jgi:hypothetical protein
MFFAVLTAILLFGLGIFFAFWFVKEKTAEKERIEEEEKKATPDPNELR